MDRLRDDDVDDVFAAEVAGVPEEGLGPVVVQRFLINEVLRLVDRPAGERARRVLHVVLGIVAQTQRKEFHHLARVIFVRMGLVVRAVVEPHEHRRILRDP